MKLLQNINKIMERFGFKESVFLIGFLSLVIWVSINIDIWVGFIVAIVGMELWRRWWRKNIQKRKYNCKEVKNMKNKKQFNKKKLLTFGMLSIFALALVTAGLVDYLSNKVQADIEVSSPMLQEVLGDDGWKEGGLSFNVYGGESQTFLVRTTNLANAVITGDTENIVTNWDGVTCDDFDSVLATTVTDGGNPDGPYDLIALNLCIDGDSNHVTFEYGPVGGKTWQSGQVDKTTIVVTFNQYATGTYEFTSRIV